MKTASTQLAAALTQAALTLATCWRIQRRDNQVFCFTDHDRDLVVAGETYRSATGYTRTALTGGNKMAVDNATLTGIVSAATITAQDVRTLVWDYAAVRIFAVDWSNPDGGQIALKRGWIGEIIANDNDGYTVELRGLTQALQQPIGEVYSPECRAMLGDARCKVNLAPWTMAGTVTQATGTDSFRGDTGQPTDWFNGGVVTITSGPNAGVRREVIHFHDQIFELLGQLPFLLTGGETFTAVRGCDHTRATCTGVFDNILNFRGEPYVPGMDAHAASANELNM